MGSTGSGSFSDYDNERKKSSNSTGQESNNGTSGEDPCTKAFSTSLDEVSTCDYYKINKIVPEAGENVKIEFNVRLIAVNEDNIILGYLPTKYNFLRACMEDGFSYSGVVNHSTLTPIPSIEVDIAPNHE